MTLQAHKVTNGEPVGIRALVCDFRGEEFIYLYPTRANGEFTDGKIVAQRLHTGGVARELYAGVFGLKVLDI